jgi:hypothetical protein
MKSGAEKEYRKILAQRGTVIAVMEASSDIYGPSAGIRVKMDETGAIHSSLPYMFDLAE